MIVSHQVANPLGAICQAFHRVDVVTGWRAEVNLCVISVGGLRVTVTYETVFCNSIKQFSRMYSLQSKAKQYNLYT